MNRPGTMVRIEAPTFTAGVVLMERAAPIIKYMRTWTLWQIQNYCRRRGWRCTVVQTEVV